MDIDTPENKSELFDENALVELRTDILNHVEDDNLNDLIDEWAAIVKGMFTQAKPFSNLAQGENLALLMLSRTSEGLSSGKLSSIMEVTSGRMANILHQLEEKQFITRAVNPLNKRMNVITITDKGIQRVAAIEEIAKSRTADILHRLGREDAETLIRIFKKLGDTKKDIADDFAQLDHQEALPIPSPSEGN